MQQKLRSAMIAMQGIGIPEVPEEVLRLQKELQGKFPNIQTVADIIETNTTLSGEVMKIINSPVLKLKSPEPINSIRDAVNTLGTDNLYNLVIAAALKNLFSDQGLVKDIMDHSVDVAFCMADIAEIVHGVSRDEAYMLGLFHNVGAMLLAKKHPEEYEQTFTKSLSNPTTSIALEDASYRTNHTMVGVLVGQKWKLPLPMINAIMLHHTPHVNKIKDDQIRAMVAMLKVSNAIVSEISLGTYCGGEFRQYEQDGLHELMMPEEFYKEVRSGLMSYSFK